MTESPNKFDLEERTARFGERVIGFCRTLSQDAITRPLVSQVVRSATSIGANYTEANNASSRKDFRNKIFLCKKESQETQHWLRMLASDQKKNQQDLRLLWQETHELTMIFQKIVSSIDKKDH